MRFRRNTIDYQITMDNLRWIEDVIPMTRSERRSLRSWVMDGHDIDSNPWEYRDEYGILLPYLQAFRLKYGYSGGLGTTGKVLRTNFSGIMTAKHSSLVTITVN